MTTSDGLPTVIESNTVMLCGESLMTKEYGHRMWQSTNVLHMSKRATCPATESNSVQQRLCLRTATSHRVNSTIRE